MKTVLNTTTSLVGASAARIFSQSKFMPRIMLAPDDDAGAAAAAAAAEAAAAAVLAAEKAAADKAAADKIAADKAAAEKAELEKKLEGLSDSEAKLLKESMSRKKKIEELEARIATFDGIDPAEIKKLVEDKKAAEKAAKDAAKKAVEASGDVERIKAMMAEDHTKQMAEAKTASDLIAADLAASRALINDLKLGSAFNGSDFVREKTVLTPTKARAVYGAHFDVEADGSLVAYDKPRGTEGRTALVDAKGKNLPFGEAIVKIIDADPEKDGVLRSNMAKGAGSKPGEGKGRDQTGDGLFGRGRLAAALAKGDIK